MASPQKENGYTPIANEILEHLSFEGINGSEYRVLHVVLRKTYGYRKKFDRISLTQFEQNTHMNRAHVVRTLSSLVHKRILLVENGLYAFNKNWEEWVVHKRILVHKRVQPSTQKDTGGSTQKDTKSSTQKDTHKRKKEIYKETNTKETRKVGGKPPRGHNPLGAEIIKAFVDVDPKNKTYYANTTQRGACDFLIAEYGLEEVRNRISVLPQTNKLPYFPSITTPLQLKDKWVQLQDAVDRKRAEKAHKKVKVI